MRSLLIVKARGSTEPQSGSRLLSPLAQRLADTSPVPARIHELHYPATFESFSTEHPARVDLGDSPGIGVNNLVRLLNTETLAHPDQGVVLLGWSQGAQVICDTLIDPKQRKSGRHAPVLIASAQQSVIGAASFGNPCFTAGEPFNAGTYTPGINGVDPRKPGTLNNYADRIRDYTTHNDVAAQAQPNATIDGHTAYFHNDLPDQALQFLRGRMSAFAERHDPE